MNDMSRLDAKRAARELIIRHLAGIGYGSRYDEYCELLTSRGVDQKTADVILKKEMDRIARLFGMKEAYFG